MSSWKEQKRRSCGHLRALFGGRRLPPRGRRRALRARGQGGAHPLVVLPALGVRQADDGCACQVVGVVARRVRRQHALADDVLAQLVPKVRRDRLGRERGHARGRAPVPQARRAAALARAQLRAGGAGSGGFRPGRPPSGCSRPRGGPRTRWGTSRGWPGCTAWCGGRTRSWRARGSCTGQLYGWRVCLSTNPELAASVQTAVRSPKSKLLHLVPVFIACQGQRHPPWRCPPLAPLAITARGGTRPLAPLAITARGGTRPLAPLAITARGGTRPRAG